MEALDLERKIEWKSYCYDEIELVYKKVEENENIVPILAELEEMALREAAENCGLLRLGGQPIAKETFQTMSDIEKEQVIYYLSGVGLAGFNSSIKEPVITITLSAHIQMVLGCTMFSILNGLEKLDGAYNTIHPKAILEIVAPLGGKKGLLKCEILIMALYPWLSVTEKSAEFVSSTLLTSAENTQSRDANVSCKAFPKLAEKKGFFAKQKKKNNK